jgi:hypothetical protein
MAADVQQPVTPQPSPAQVSTPSAAAAVFATREAGRRPFGMAGSLLLFLGAGGLVASGMSRLFDGWRPTDGALPACALLLTLLGFAARFPAVLQDGTTNATGEGNVSAMRVAVLMIVSVFTLVTVKAGWSVETLTDLKIDPSWAWVLAAALGGKAAQSFAENAAPK